MLGVRDWLGDALADIDTDADELMVGDWDADALFVFVRLGVTDCDGVFEGV